MKQYMHGITSALSEKSDIIFHFIHNRLAVEWKLTTAFRLTRAIGRLVADSWTHRQSLIFQTDLCRSDEYFSDFPALARQYPEIFS